jgi:hypothetical protein
MFSFLLTAAIYICPVPIIENYSKFPWTDYDYELIEHYMKRCPQDFPESSPCMIKFVKLDEFNYLVRCGAKIIKK